jgi:hypothetical protein
MLQGTCSILVNAELSTTDNHGIKCMIDASTTLENSITSLLGKETSFNHIKQPIKVQSKKRL